jgi:hypothetical protein
MESVLKVVLIAAGAAILVALAFGQVHDPVRPSQSPTPMRTAVQHGR